MYMSSNHTLTPDKFLTYEEKIQLEALLERYRDSDLRNTTMLLIMLKVGCRPREVLNLTWGDVDRIRMRIFVKTLKRGKSRYVPISQAMLLRLEELGFRDSDAVIFDLSYNMFLRIWKDYRPVEKKLHCLRHTFAMSCYEKKKDLKVVQDLLGHRNLTTTAIYLDFESSDAEKRVALGL